MVHKTVGNTQIPLRVLKINRVNFVGHCARPYLPFFKFLLKVTHGRVKPHVPTHSNQNGIKQRQMVVEHAHPIMRLNLGSVRIKCKVETLQELFTKSLPLELWVCE